MKYSGKIDYPSIGDEIIVPRQSTSHMVVDTKYGRFSQGDLIVQENAKGVFVVLGVVTHTYYRGKLLLVQRVFSDKLKPSKGGIETAVPEYSKSARNFLLKEKKVNEEALNIINEYLED